MYIYTYVFMYIHTYTYTYIYVCTSIHIYVSMYMYTHIYLHAHTHIYAHIRTHTHTHTHTHMLPPSLFLILLHPLAQHTLPIYTTTKLPNLTCQIKCTKFNMSYQMCQVKIWPRKISQIAQVKSHSTCGMSIWNVYTMSNSTNLSNFEEGKAIHTIKWYLAGRIWRVYRVKFDKFVEFLEEKVIRTEVVSSRSNLTCIPCQI